jgi:hypothetical protein
MLGTGNSFDVVRWITVRCLGDTIERPLDVLEPKKKGT